MHDSDSPTRGLLTQTKTTSGQRSVVPKKKPESDDEKLLQFLNSSEPPLPRTGKMQLGTPVKKATFNLETQNRGMKENVKGKVNIFFK